MKTVSAICIAIGLLVMFMALGVDVEQPNAVMTIAGLLAGGYALSAVGKALSGPIRPPLDEFHREAEPWTL
ncbi:hypothetical protein [Marinobacter salicampi]|uniref:hypothetical protein n=1 Tax=Marinobacter salicampi TaxID=435907 RepID=UPI00140AFDEB|nr:hypothetical protein [Marinobacter salicampi]